MTHLLLLSLSKRLVKGGGIKLFLGPLPLYVMRTWVILPRKDHLVLQVFYFLGLDFLRYSVVYLLNFPLPQHLLNILLRGRCEVLEQVELHFSETLYLINVDLGILV